ncbi:CoA transferase [Bacillus sp. DNRA2]|uniref:CaiB/BaiF CoA transferase family protein n=1 Tax=Bacillus sp. DNRA2 TaxID=2723053 RepID=UPI00145F7803|nr:CoA transferase [Bacillus sp. DNRA2]NMD69713.1 CoA transferase [Bacillus sp. DNRA2]
MLSNIRILDFSNYIPGPFATLRLAELGAEVIKIESLSGDLARSTEMIGDKEGPVFRAMNRNKKSIAVNLKTAEGKEIVQQLIKKADVVVESFRPGVMDKLGLGYEAAKELKNDIVYCSITGYGQEGELSKLGSHDLNFLSLSGVLSQMKNSHGEPIHPTITFADYIGAFAASERILAGIIAKLQTGKGSYHSISVTDVMTSIMVNHAIVAEETGFQQGLSVLNGTMISYAIYPTKDKRFVGFGALEFKFWENFCQAVYHPEWISAHGTEANEGNPVYLEVKDLFLQKTLEEWAVFGREVDCCLTPILEINELKGYGNQNVYKAEWEDEQVKMHGDLKQKNQTPPPKLGEHSMDIVSKLLDKSEEQVKEWEKKGILKSEISKLLK